MSGGELERIEKLKKKLYSRGSEGLSGVSEHTLRDVSREVPEEWKHDDLPQRKEDDEEENMKPHSFYRKFLIFSVFFFLVASLFAGYQIFIVGNSVSPQNIRFSFFGPPSIHGGDSLSLSVSLKNENSLSLEKAIVTIEYPKGTRKVGNDFAPLPRETKIIGEVKPGSEARFLAGGVIFGEEGTSQSVHFTLQYRIANSNALYQKEASYEFSLGSPPISFTVVTPKEANEGEALTLSAEVSSNSEETLKNVVVRAEYPQGFIFKSSNPPAYRDKSVWRIGDLGPKEKRMIQIQGNIFGTNEDSKFFRFESGIESDAEQGKIETVLATDSEEVSIRKDPFYLKLAVNNSSEPEVVAPSGREIEGVITYINTLPNSLVDAQIFVSLSGISLEESSIQADKGYYDSSKNVLRFDKTTLSKLSELASGEEGELRFSFARKTNVNPSSFRDPQVTLSLLGKAKRNDESGEETSTNITRRVKFETEVVVSSLLYFADGPFENTGSIPPKVEQETTYTALWTMGSATSDVTDAEGKTLLPQGVKYIGPTSPSSEKIFYNDTDRSLTWKAGFIKAGSGWSSPPKRVYFRVSFTPSANQVGQSPELLSDTIFSAKNRFTGAKLSEKARALNLRLSDSQVSQGHDIVVP